MRGVTYAVAAAATNAAAATDASFQAFLLCAQEQLKHSFLEAAPDAGAAAKIAANAGVPWQHDGSAPKSPFLVTCSFKDGQPLHDSRLHGQLPSWMPLLFTINCNAFSEGSAASAANANSILYVVAVTSCTSRAWVGLAWTVGHSANNL